MVFSGHEEAAEMCLQANESCQIPKNSPTCFSGVNSFRGSLERTNREHSEARPQQRGSPGGSLFFHPNKHCPNGPLQASAASMEGGVQVCVCVHERARAL